MYLLLQFLSRGERVSSGNDGLLVVLKEGVTVVDMVLIREAGKAGIVVLTPGNERCGEW